MNKYLFYRTLRYAHRTMTTGEILKYLLLGVAIFCLGVLIIGSISFGFYYAEHKGEDDEYTRTTEIQAEVINHADYINDHGKKIYYVELKYNGCQQVFEDKKIYDKYDIGDMVPCICKYSVAPRGPYENPGEWYPKEEK